MNPLAQWFTWEGAPCQVGTRSVKLAGLSSKSTCKGILHCHIPCFHFMLCVAAVIINTEYINNIYMYCILPEVTHFLSIG